MQDSRVLFLECVTGAQVGPQYRKCCVTLFILMWGNWSVSEKKGCTVYIMKAVPLNVRFLAFHGMRSLTGRKMN